MLQQIRGFHSSLLNKKQSRQESSVYNVFLTEEKKKKSTGNNSMLILEKGGLTREEEATKPLLSQERIQTLRQKLLQNRKVQHLTPTRNIGYSTVYERAQTLQKRKMEPFEEYGLEKSQTPNVLVPNFASKTL